MTRRASSPAHAGTRASRARRAAVLCSTAALIATACSSSNGSLADLDGLDEADAADATSSTTSTTSTVAVDDGLAGIELVATAADPFDRVAVTGLQGLPVDDVALWMRAPEGAETDVFVPVYLVADDNPESAETPVSAEMVVPFHPDDPMGGGEVELYFGDVDDAAGPTIEFSIGPMTPADGAWATFTDTFRDAIDETARELDSSAEELAAVGFDDVPDLLLPLKLSLTLLDDGTENSLAGIYDSPQLTDEDREILDALAAQMGLAEVFTVDRTEMSEAALDAVGDTDDRPTGFRRTRAPVRTMGAPLASTPAPQQPAPQQSGDCRTSNITVDSAAELSEMISRALDNRIMEGGPVEMVLQDLNTITTIGGFFPVVGTAFGVGGVIFGGIEAYHNGVAGMLPSSVTSLDARFRVLEFLEDFVLPSSWTEVTATAQSTGWDGTGEVAGVALGAVSTGVSYGIGSTFDLNWGQALDIDLGLFAGENAAAAVLDRTTNLLNFCPQTWRVDVTGDPWSHGSARLGYYDTSETSVDYEPTDVGQNRPFVDTIRIVLNPQQFRNQDVFVDSPPITTSIIRVEGPELIEVDNPGELIEVEFTVHDAHDDSLEYLADHGGWQNDSLVATDPPTRQNTLITSQVEDHYPYFAVVRSASTTGLRGPDAPQRSQLVQIRLQELIVRPGSATTMPGGLIQYTATDRQGNPVDVTWSATGGVISQDGLYIAGDEPGEFTVTAVEVANPARSTSVPVTIGEGDACLAGTWQLDNEAFVDTMAATLDVAAQMGGEMPPGFEFEWSFDGPFYLRFDDEAGSAVGWRNAWQMIMTGSFEGFSFDSVTEIDSIETFRYVVEDERLVVRDINMVDITVRSRHGGPAGDMTAVVTPDSGAVSLFGAPTTEFEADTGLDDTPSGATLDYTCDDQTLVTSPTDADIPMRWNRVSDAPDPPLG